MRQKAVQRVAAGLLTTTRTKAREVTGVRRVRSRTEGKRSLVGLVSAVLTLSAPRETTQPQLYAALLVLSIPKVCAEPISSGDHSISSTALEHESIRSGFWKRHDSVELFFWVFMAVLAVFGREKIGGWLRRSIYVLASPAGQFDFLVRLSFLAIRT